MNGRWSFLVAYCKFYGVRSIGLWNNTHTVQISGTFNSDFGKTNSNTRQRGTSIFKQTFETRQSNHIP